MGGFGDQQSNKYSCRKCGHPFDAYPPDGEHKYPKLEPCSKGDSVPQDYKCKECGNTNTLHWDGSHPVTRSLGRRTVSYD